MRQPARRLVPLAFWLVVTTLPAVGFEAGGSCGVDSDTQ
jgi:hypothetical protein